MNRRNFLSLVSAGVAGIAFEQAIPLGRLWSFPKEIKIAPRNRFLTMAEFDNEIMRRWRTHNRELEFGGADLAFGEDATIVRTYRVVGPSNDIIVVNEPYTLLATLKDASLAMVFPGIRYSTIRILPSESSR